MIAMSYRFVSLINASIAQWSRIRIRKRIGKRCAEIMRNNEFAKTFHKAMRNVRQGLRPWPPKHVRRHVGFGMKYKEKFAWLTTEMFLRTS